MPRDETLNEVSNILSRSPPSFEQSFGQHHASIGLNDEHRLLDLSIDLSLAVSLVDSLKLAGQHMLVMLEGILNAEQCLRRAYEYLGETHLVLVRLVAEMRDQGLHTIAGAAVEFWPRCWTQALVAVQESLVRTAIHKAGTADAQILHQAEILNLMLDNAIIKLVGSLILVRLDASNVPWLLRRQQLHQICQTLTELCDRGHRTPLRLQLVQIEQLREYDILR